MAVYKLSAAGSLKTPRTNYSSFLAGNPAFELPGNYDSIATANGTGASGVITFSSIPSTYKHLQLRIIARGTTATTYLQHNITLNGVASNYYAMHEIYGDGTNAGGNSDAASTYMSGGLFPGTSFASNIYAPLILDLLDYTDTNKNKVARTTWGLEIGGGGFIDFRSSLAINTSAINSITITASSGNYTTPSSFALYGIK